MACTCRGPVTNGLDCPDIAQCPQVADLACATVTYPHVVEQPLYCEDGAVGIRPQPSGGAAIGRYGLMLDSASLAGDGVDSSRPDPYGSSRLGIRLSADAGNRARINSGLLVDPCPAPAAGVMWFRLTTSEEIRKNIIPMVETVVVMDKATLKNVTFTPATSRLVLPLPGLYEITAHVEAQAPNNEPADVQRKVSMRINSTGLTDPGAAGGFDLDRATSYGGECSTIGWASAGAQVWLTAWAVGQEGMWSQQATLAVRKIIDGSAPTSRQEAHSGV